MLWLLGTLAPHHRCHRMRSHAVPNVINRASRLQNANGNEWNEHRTNQQANKQTELKNEPNKQKEMIQISI